MSAEKERERTAAPGRHRHKLEEATKVRKEKRRQRKVRSHCTEEGLQSQFRDFLWDRDTQEVTRILLRGISGHRLS